MKFTCKNCHLEFESEDTGQCPRCSSANISTKKTEEQTGEMQGEKKEPRKFVFGAPVSDTKESWMKFHNVGAVQVCPGCGGKEFNFDWKKREKTCNKCGEIMPLRRR